MKLNVKVYASVNSADACFIVLRLTPAAEVGGRYFNCDFLQFSWLADDDGNYKIPFVHLRFFNVPRFLALFFVLVPLFPIYTNGQKMEARQCHCELIFKTFIFWPWNIQNVRKLLKVALFSKLNSRRVNLLCEICPYLSQNLAWLQWRGVSSCIICPPFPQTPSSGTGEIASDRRKIGWVKLWGRNKDEKSARAREREREKYRVGWCAVKYRGEMAFHKDWGSSDALGRNYSDAILISFLPIGYDCTMVFCFYQNVIRLFCIAVFGWQFNPILRSV
jgi:hypothetical protein